ncbi:MAG: TetR/AcrR family transcriptional regulator [Acidimicrobiales bacterium]|nr:TetR/AcrR family transcriptional regulator [Acidimicrobiales bacterium]
MTRLRWGNDAPEDSAAARERLVDAAEACIDRFGLSKTTLEDVAAEAQVSRATIYRYFGNRDELILEVLLRELDRQFDTSLAEFVKDADTPAKAARAIVDASVYLLGTIRRSPKLQLFLNREGASVTATIAGASRAFFSAVVKDLRPYLAAAQRAGTVRTDIDLDEAGEWIVRTIISLLTVEGPTIRSAADERRMLAMFLVPALVPGDAAELARAAMS